MSFADQIQTWQAFFTTVAGRRRVALPASTVERLRRHGTEQKELWLAVGRGYGDRDLVFATVNEAPIRPNTLSCVREAH